MKTAQSKKGKHHQHKNCKMLNILDGRNTKQFAQYQTSNLCLCSTPPVFNDAYSNFYFGKLYINFIMIVDDLKDKAMLFLQPGDLANH